MHQLLHTVRRALVPALFLSLVSFVSASPNAAVLSFSSGGITGCFGIKLDPKNQSLLDVNSVSLSIDGIKFKNKDVVFWYDPVGDVNYIGGIVNGADQVIGGESPDFMIAWFPKSPAGSLSFTSSDHVSVEQTFISLSITQKKGSGKP